MESFECFGGRGNIPLKKLRVALNKRQDRLLKENNELQVDDRRADVTKRWPDLRTICFKKNIQRHSPPIELVVGQSPIEERRDHKYDDPNVMEDVMTRYGGQS